LSEILKNLWGKLYAWAFPVALTLGVYCLFVDPKTTFAHEWLEKTSDTEKAAIFVAATTAIALSLNAFSTPLYRILEGYLLWPRWLQEYGTKRQLKRKRMLEKSIAGHGWRRGLALEKLALYPKREEQIVPTRFGNAIRSFETYGKTRFNLDSQTLWYELYAVAPKYIQTEIKGARSSVDFFVALIYLSAFLSLVTFALAALDGFELSILVVCILAFLVTLLCRWLVVRATAEWGYTVRALVNIGRVKLADSMGLQLPESLEKEKVMWGLVTRYGFFGETVDGARLDEFRKKPETGGQRPFDKNHSPASVQPEEDDDKLEEGDDEQ
jgi:hypothetical protein